MSNKSGSTLGFFEKYIYLWIALCAALGLLLGNLFPKTVQGLHAVNIGGVSVSIAILMFLLMYPTMAKIQLEEVPHAVKNIGPMALWPYGPNLDCKLDYCTSTDGVISDSFFR